MKRNNIGFTLIEVLIALAIVAIALTAIVKSSDYNIKDLNYLQQKTIANLLAQNILAQAQLNLISTSAQGEMELMNQNLYWTVHTETTPDKNVMKITVAVAIKVNAQPLISIWGFKSS